MAYFEGRSVTITSPVAAQVLMLALSAWVDGKPQPPGEIRLLMTELHWLANETGPRHSETRQRNCETRQEIGSVTMGVNEASEILSLSKQMVRRYCDDETLLAVPAHVTHGPWVIDGASVEAFRAERELKSG